ncbi:hypothetical protein [Laspinema olomoucense]|uniref:Uncharacterized protein n=1 Tax=Laspinema olomoucense D3b TaxID=2953688 RepID=A0ABT2N3E2_9CYAN|nr:hypothetical protein [Laspinema sp. D3b]MCT7976275.1 hypothetical protein [Laspinema sp. D3b]
MSKLSTDQQSVKLWSVVQAHHPGLIADRREKISRPVCERSPIACPVFRT